jgi:hypothetical protein
MATSHRDPGNEGDRSGRVPDGAVDASAWQDRTESSSPPSRDALGKDPITKPTPRTSPTKSLRRSDAAQQSRAGLACNPTSQETESMPTLGIRSAGETRALSESLRVLSPAGQRSLISWRRADHIGNRSECLSLCRAKKGGNQGGSGAKDRRTSKPTLDCRHSHGHDEPRNSGHDGPSTQDFRRLAMRPARAQKRRSEFDPASAVLENIREPANHSIGSPDLDGRGQRLQARLPGQLKSGGRDEAVEQAPAYSQDGAPVAHVLAQVFQPDPVGDQRWLSLHDHQVLRPPARSNLQDQATPN